MPEIIQSQQNTRVPSPPTWREILQSDTPDTAYDFITIIYGWYPIIGHALGIYNLAIGKKKRGLFFLLYATLTPLIVFPFLLYSKRFQHFFNMDHSQSQ